MESLREALDSIVGHIIQERPTVAPMFKWKDIVGPLASMSTPDEIENGVIKITANSPSVSYLLNLKKNEIKRKIEEVSKIKIKKVIIR